MLCRFQICSKLTSVGGGFWITDFQLDWNSAKAFTHSNTHVVPYPNLQEPHFKGGRPATMTPMMMTAVWKKKHSLKLSDWFYSPESHHRKKHVVKVCWNGGGWQISVHEHPWDRVMDPAGVGRRKVSNMRQRTFKGKTHAWQHSWHGSIAWKTEIRWHTSAYWHFADHIWSGLQGLSDKVLDPISPSAWCAVVIGFFRYIFVFQTPVRKKKKKWAHKTKNTRKASETRKNIPHPFKLRRSATRWLSLFWSTKRGCI